MTPKSENLTLQPAVRRIFAPHSEILAPAGSFPALEAAVRCGADAVYLGGKAFNARRGAGNFDHEELKTAVALCHSRAVKLHFTLNTLVDDSELPKAKEEIEHICVCGADVLILQDIGLALLARACATDIKRHASTQMSVQTPAGVKLLEQLGYSRVVLPRELNRDEIAEIVDKSNIEVECFVHGANCMCVSGQCYMSAMLGSRSGNRGLCAQPCRLPFACSSGFDHALSLKDNCLIEHLNDMQNIGVASFKIEGRMKRPEYVAAAVTVCRKSLCGEKHDDEMQNLRAVFSRSGFTEGYYTSSLGADMFGTRTKEDVTAASGVLKELAHLYEKETPLVPVEFILTAHAGENITLAASSGGFSVFADSGEQPQSAMNTPSTAEAVSERLAKCGGTPFFADNTEVEIDDGLFLPASLLNGLRRLALDELMLKLETVKPKSFTDIKLKFQPHTIEVPNKRKIYAFFSNSAEIPDRLDGIDIAYVSYDTDIETMLKLESHGVKVGAVIPRGLFGMQKVVADRLGELKKAGINLAYCGNLDALALARAAGMLIHTGFGMNIFNTLSVKALEKLGVQQATLSFELTLAQAEKIGGEIPRGIIAYGRLPLMLTRNNPLCSGRSEPKFSPGVLTDRLGVSFPIIRNGECFEILNSRALYLADRLDEIRGMDFITLYFTTESKVECASIISKYRSGASPSGEFTRGLYYRGVE